jgi:hypothetical protein
MDAYTFWFPRDLRGPQRTRLPHAVAHEVRIVFWHNCVHIADPFHALRTLSVDTGIPERNPSYVKYQIGCRATTLLGRHLNPAYAYRRGKIPPYSQSWPLGATHCHSNYLYLLVSVTTCRSSPYSASFSQQKPPGRLCRQKGSPYPKEIISLLRQFYVETSL